jgi:hypothetical protein
MSGLRSRDSSGLDATVRWIPIVQLGEWQLLKTAPRDGSKIDVWTENGVRYVDVFWYEGPAFPEGAFAYYDSNLRDLIDVDDATHWMPRPAPPRQEKTAHEEDASAIYPAE